jgi:hypothetical protein
MPQLHPVDAEGHEVVYKMDHEPIVASQRLSYITRFPIRPTKLLSTVAPASLAFFSPLYGVEFLWLPISTTGKDSAPRKMTVMSRRNGKCFVWLCVFDFQAWQYLPIALADSVTDNYNDHTCVLPVTDGRIVLTLR